MVRRYSARVLAAVAVILVILAPLSNLAAQPPAGADTAGVRRAALDYLEGFYEGDTAKFVRSVAPTVLKLGYRPAPDSTGRYEGGTMTFADFLSHARRTKARNALAPATAPKEVTVYDIQDQTASVKVRASWGIDYLLLARQEGRWRITHVLWQTAPRRASIAGNKP